MTGYDSIAAHFDSPLVSVGREVLHSTLQSTKVFTAESITSSLVVSQDGEEIAIPIGNSELHIQVLEDGRFEIYVPADEGARDFCVASTLPRELAGCLLKTKPSRVDSQVVSVVASIIHAKPASMGRILEANGIMELDLPPYDEDDDLDYDLTTNQGPVVRSGSGYPVSPSTPSRRPVNEGRSSLSPSQQTPNRQYGALVAQVAAVARSIAFPEQQATPDMLATLQNSAQKSFSFYVGDQAEWRRMVGAAGELFVSLLIF